MLLYIDIGDKTFIYLKHAILKTLQEEKIWIFKQDGPAEIIETTQIGFFAKTHPEIYRPGLQNKINKSMNEHFIKNKSELLIKSKAYPELKNWTGEELPDIQVHLATIPGLNNKGSTKRVGISVQSEYRGIYRFLLHLVCNDLEIEYVDFIHKYDERSKVTYDKLVRTHQEFMYNTNTINIHCMERE